MGAEWVKELAELVARRRRQAKLSLEGLEALTGISTSTLSRIENGVGWPTSRTLLALSHWLGAPVERLVGMPGNQGERVIYYPDEPIPDIVAALLRADPALSPANAAALGEIFRAAYEQYQKFSEKVD